MGEDDDLDLLPESARRRLGRQVILAAMAENEDDADRPVRPIAGERPKGEATEENNFDYDRPWLPVDEDGKEIPPHPDDPRFNADGNPKEDWVKDGGTKAWALRNSRWNPETGEFEYYADLPDYQRDPHTGQWTKRTGQEAKEHNERPDRKDISGKSLPDFPPAPPIGEDPKTRRGRQALGRWFFELGVWGEQERQRQKDGGR